MRAALYARFSTELQNVGSIADQLEACRRHADRLGADVVGVFEDAAISGASTANRPGLQALLAGARARAFDVVVAEDLDRLTRSGGDAWDIYEELKAHGVAIDTIADGRAQTMHIGLKGTMGALFLEQLAQKTRRGLAGVAREGRHAGGRVYGYRRVRRLDDAGEPVPGVLEVDEAEAHVVRRIFRDYASGLAPRAIAAALNAEGVPAPRGGLWNASTINGNAARGNGVLHNRLYAGELVWGRQTWTKDRRTGKRRARTADPSALERRPVPHLAIVDADLWRHAHEQYRAVKRQGPQLQAARRPKSLLSGLVRCACGGPMTLGGPERRLVCTIRREKGEAACGQEARSPRMSDVEARVIEAVRANLLHPAVIEAAIAEFQAESRRLQKDAGRDRARREAELAEVKRKAARLVDQVADGHLSGSAVADRLRELEARRAQLEAELAAEPAGADVVTLHPAAAGQYRRLMEELQAAIAADVAGETADDPTTIAEARAAFRAVIRAVRVIPAEGRGRYTLELDGDLAPMLALGSGQKETPRAEARGVPRIMLGAGAGFEPATFRL